MEKYLERETQMQSLRIFTPILLGAITILGGITAYFVCDKLNSMTDMNLKTFTLISEVKNDLNDYKVETGEHLATIDQELIDEVRK